MNYLLDTCLLSEFTRKAPEPNVVRWMDSVEEEQLYLSVISIGEIQQVIDRLPSSRRKNDLSIWLNNGLINRFGSRTISLDISTMLLWGSLTAKMESSGKPLPVVDALLVASALQYNLVIATRNVADFLPCGVRVINPWE
ncbi:MAG: type II toxin-antitoxin system VapC family toxin [Anaerolineaceae bacterium]|nr:type II toxin-antitoxin system VapC family toxin [Anaerolineaceae bacterium]